jgi:hypothetical protein
VKAACRLLITRVSTRLTVANVTVENGLIYIVGGDAGAAGIGEEYLDRFGSSFFHRFAPRHANDCDSPVIGQAAAAFARRDRLIGDLP